MSFIRVHGPITVDVDGAGNVNFQIQTPIGYPKVLSASMSYGGAIGVPTAGDALAVGAIFTADHVENYSQEYTPVNFWSVLAVEGTLPESITVVIDMLVATADTEFSADSYGGAVIQ